MSTDTTTRTTRFYTDVLGLPVPAVGGPGDDGSDHHAIPIPVTELPRLRGRLIAAGAPVQDLGPTALSFRDPGGRHVDLVAEHALSEAPS